MAKKSFEVILGDLFSLDFQKLDTQYIQIIRKFMDTFTENGYANLKGKNKKSSDIPKNDPEYQDKLNLVKQYKLWHYHIGIPKYIKSINGKYYTSDYVLHYKKISKTKIVIVDFSSHNPFKLPSLTYLQ